MIHFSCDRCGKTINIDSEIRYVVNFQAHASVEIPGASVWDDDPVYLQELQNVTNDLFEIGELSCPEEIYHQRRFDLCETCYHRYLQNPLGSVTDGQKFISRN